MKRTTKQALSILPGDYMTIEVPPSGMLHNAKLSKLAVWNRAADVVLSQHRIKIPGTYVYRVKCSLHSKPGFKRYTLWKMIARGVAARLSVSIPIDPQFTGYLFIGRDKTPVRFTHEPNLAERLKRSKRSKT